LTRPASRKRKRHVVHINVGDLEYRSVVRLKDGAVRKEGGVYRR
jgi:hypothetical protein